MVPAVVFIVFGLGLGRCGGPTTPLGGALSGAGRELIGLFGAPVLGPIVEPSGNFGGALDTGELMKRGWGLGAWWLLFAAGTTPDVNPGLC